MLGARRSALGARRSAVGARRSAVVPGPLWQRGGMRERQVTVAAVLAGAAALVAVHLALRGTDWDYSEGVYALTAQQIVHGGDLYGRIVGAQPPGVFLVGAALLAIHDSLEWLRLAVGALQLGAGLIAARIVYRITGDRPATVLTPALMLLTPWAVHEHGALIPEVVALPAMLGAVLLGADARRGAAAGALCGVMVLVKLPLVVPAIVIVALAADRRRALAAAAGVVAAGLAAATLADGGGFWRDAVTAQLQTGTESLHALAGFWAQAGWNLAGLLVCAGAALAARGSGRDRRLLTMTAAVAAANLVTFVTNVKVGTGLNVTVPVEASLVPLAMCGMAFARRAARGSAAVVGASGARRPGPAATAVVCALALAFTLAQSASLIAAPHHPVPFLRPFSAPAWTVVLDRTQLRRAVAAARACPAGEAYGGSPLVAMVAHRALPDGQPDQFLPAHAAVLAPIERRITAVTRVCPGP